MHKKQKLILYPLRFKEIYKKKIWGGNGLKKILNKRGSKSKIGESWELSLRDKNISIVANGPLKGMSLAKILPKWPKEIMGNECYMKFTNTFPLIVKFIDAKEKLSLQVHPPDEYAQQYEVENNGKMEAWYIVYAPKEAKVIRGVLPGTTVREFIERLKNNTIEECLNVMSVKEGDVIFIPPGTIHTAYGGVIILEIEQNSDITYRICDWGRKGFNGKSRQLDIEKALNIIDFHSMGVSKYKPSRISGYSYKRKLLLKCEKFTMEFIDLNKRRIKEKANLDRFHILTIVEGSGRFYYGREKTKAMAFRKGEAYLMPAYLGNYDISTRGICKIVCTYI